MSNTVEKSFVEPLQADLKLTCYIIYHVLKIDSQHETRFIFNISIADSRSHQRPYFHAKSYHIKTIFQFSSFKIMQMFINTYYSWTNVVKFNCYKCKQVWLLQLYLSFIVSSLSLHTTTNSSGTSSLTYSQTSEKNVFFVLNILSHVHFDNFSLHNLRCFKSPLARLRNNLRISDFPINLFVSVTFHF